jgi:antirestriction protein
MNNETNKEGTNENPEQSETRRADSPRIYCADLAAYNNGALHGVWVDATQDAGEMWEQINAMLARSPEPSAEEIAIHDYENFGPIHLSEYESIETVATIGAGYTEHGRAFLHWIDYVGTSDPTQFDRFEDAFEGRWDSMEAYAEELADEYGVERILDAHIPDFIRSYVRLDVEAFARDLSFSYHVAEDQEQGGVYLFAP